VSPEAALDDGYFNGEAGAQTGLTRNINGTVVALDDFITQGQAEPCSLAFLLGREERFEYSLEVFFRDSRSRILKTAPNDTVVMFRLHGQYPAAGPFLHGLIRVVQQIQEDLLKLAEISHRLGRWLSSAEPPGPGVS